ncbi:hypothetical protein FPV67DRAFT_1457015 [Lyophyllum atratum]|nr:hypothetical protein FPV67DRAFT_1457015 [Lyophyllum atratum]
MLSSLTTDVLTRRARRDECSGNLRGSATDMGRSNDADISGMEMAQNGDRARADAREGNIREGPGGVGAAGAWVEGLYDIHITIKRNPALFRTPSHTDNDREVAATVATAPLVWVEVGVYGMSLVLPVGVGCEDHAAVAGGIGKGKGRGRDVFWSRGRGIKGIGPLMTDNAV